MAIACSKSAEGYTQLTLDLRSPKEAFPKAREAAQKAVELDDSLAEAHTSLATVELYEWDWSGAEREFRRAIDLNPSDAPAHRLYGIALAYTGRSEEALRELKRALELDPLSTPNDHALAVGFFCARQYDQSIEQDQKTLELDPNFFFAHSVLGFAYVQKSMYKEGIAESEKALAISPNNTQALSGLGYAYAAAGRRLEAQKVLDQLNELSKQKYVPAFFRAAIYAALGEKDKAFEWLEKAYQERYLFGAIRVDPAFDPLRSDQRFEDLLRRMNLQP